MNKTNFTVNGDLLDTTAKDGNTFKGFGLLSCNNSSRLLLDYRIEHPESYQKILNSLFAGTYPLMKMVKIELGDDANTSSGTEPSTKRAYNENANVKRGAGYILIHDIKKINPNVKTCLLRWGEPGYLKKIWRNAKSDDPDNKVP